MLTNASPMKASLSIGELISVGANLLAPTSDSPKLDVQLLIAFVLDKPTTYLVTWPDKSLSKSQFTQFISLFERRLNGEPIAYLTGKKGFWSLELFVSSATLIPRPDTEVLVEKALEIAQQFTEKTECRLLDLGTGTGAIALSLASELKMWKVEAIDYSHDAVKLSERNAIENQITNCDIYQSDWFDNVPMGTKFDLIVSNPPYIDEEDVHLSQGDVRFEPKSALVASNNGLADIEHISKNARDYLVDNGYLIFEHGYDQGEKVRNILHSLGFENVNTKQDYAGNDRITFASYNNKN